MEARKMDGGRCYKISCIFGAIDCMAKKMQISKKLRAVLENVM